MTSPLLIDEPPLQVLPSLAVAVGLNEAILLQQIHYWMKIKQADRDRYAGSFRDGRCWVYNSVEKWREQFPFWSRDTIQRGLTSLKNQEVLIVAQLAPDPRDRTNWYTIDYERMKTVMPATPDAKGGGKGGKAVRQSKSPESKSPVCGNALPQSAVMALPQPAAMQDGDLRQCLSETTTENTAREVRKPLNVRSAPAAAPAPATEPGDATREDATRGDAARTSNDFPTDQKSLLRAAEHRRLANQAVTLTGDEKSRRRYEQLAAFCERAGARELWDTACRLTSARLTKSTDPLASPGGYFCKVLTALCIDAHVYLPVGEKAERDDIRARIARSFVPGADAPNPDADDGPDEGEGGRSPSVRR